MKTLTNILFLVLSFFFCGAAVAGGPSFIVEENGNDYVMYLKIEDASNINTILVEGDFSKNGVNDALAMSINASELTSGISLTEIQKLSNEYDYANYVVKILDNDGYILEYPMVQVALTDFSMASAQ